MSSRTYVAPKATGGITSPNLRNRALSLTRFLRTESVSDHENLTGEFIGLLIGGRVRNGASYRNVSVVNCCKALETVTLTKSHPEQGMHLLINMYLSLYPCVCSAVNTACSESNPSSVCELRTYLDDAFMDGFVQRTFNSRPAPYARLGGVLSPGTAW